MFGYLKGVPIMCMQGRFHYYEGYPLWKVIVYFFLFHVNLSLLENKTYSIRPMTIGIDIYVYNIYDKSNFRISD